MPYVRALALAAAWVSPTLTICFGGTICAIPDTFCDETRGFYDWQPDFGHGWRVELMMTDGVVQLTNPEAV